MKRFFILALLVHAACGLAAQNHALKIPGTANVVGSMNLGKLNSMMPMAEWDKTSLGKKLTEMGGSDSTLQYNCLQDLGVDLTSTLYYFHTENDSMHLNTVLVTLTDAVKTDQFFAKKEVVKLAGNVRRYADNDSTGYFMWNNVQMIYVKALIKDAYFSENSVAQRHGLSYNKPGVYLDEEVAPDDADIVTVITEDLEKSDTVIIDEDEMVEEDTVAIGYEAADENDFDYYNDLKIKKGLMEKAAIAAINEFFYTTPVNSILSNSRYLKNNDPAAAAFIWVDKPMNFYSSLVPSYLLYKTNPLEVAYKLNEEAGYESFAASLLLNDRTIRMHTQMELSAEMATMQQKILDRKLNKRFFKYMQTDSMLGYMSWAFDTKAYLEQMPQLLDRTYASLGGGVGQDEASLAAEFISLLIDEEAIANMIKGDAMVIFDGVYQQEVKYTDYTYDENFKATEVEKSRTETLPRFLMMLSSTENNLVKKLINYGIKKSVVKQNGTFYEIDIPTSPVKLFFINKDDIFFLTNSISNIEQISAGTFKSNISKKEKKTLSTHPFTMYINPKNISDKIAQTELGATESLAEMMNAFNKMGEVRMQATPVKNNIFGADLWMDVPAGNTNAVTYFFSLFDGLIK